MSLIKMNPTRLVFCGGGTKCLAFVHTLIELEKVGRLRNVNEYWGTSAGALLASLLAISKSATMLNELTRTIQYTQFRDMDITNLLSIHTTWGLDDGKSLTKEIERIFETIEPDGKNKTMKDVSGLHIVITDLTLRETVVCSAKNYPNIRVVDAIRASMSLPFFFRPYINPENSHVWVDGAVRANFPWMLLPNDEARKESLGFTFDKTAVGSPTSLMEYIFSMIHFDESKKFQYLKDTWASNICFYTPPPFPSWFMRLREEDFKLLETMGLEMFTKITSSLQMRETPPPFARPHIPSSFPLHCKNELSDSLSRAHEPSLDSSQPQSPSKAPVSRRWSL